MKLEIYSTDFRKIVNIKFYENPTSGSCVARCGRTDRQTNMKQIIVAFRSFTNAPKHFSDQQFFKFVSAVGNKRERTAHTTVIYSYRCWQCFI